MFTIGNFSFANSSQVFIIAELSANHGGSLQNALDTIKAAKRVGANAIKLQTFTADTITLNTKTPDFLVNQGTLWDGKYLHELYTEAFTPWEWHEQLFTAAKDEGLICFSSPFDKSAVDFLEKLNCPAYKIASLEITDIPLIKYVASKGKPVIISTGIANESDIELAVRTCRDEGNAQIALLKCTTSYPAPIEEANLSMIQNLAQKFQVISGLSDHTQGIIAPIVATALGARIIEKHFILNSSIGGPDAVFSLTEPEFSSMVTSVRDAEKALGEINYTLTEKQNKSKAFSRSLYVAEDVEAGEEITEKNVRSVRPGYGLHPKNLPLLLGKKFIKSIKKGTPFNFDLIN